MAWYYRGDEPNVTPTRFRLVAFIVIRCIVTVTGSLSIIRCCKALVARADA